MIHSNFNKKSKYNVIGVMSGTSLDGIDLCLSSFEYGTSWQVSNQRCRNGGIL